ncbi:STAS domain-containing protein [Streptomyces virginiae]
MGFHMMMRRYGPTAHLTPAGELDLAGRLALDEVQAGLDSGVAVVACDMRHLTFLDVSGLNALIGFVRRLDARGIAFFAYNWQPQPRRLMNLIDGLYPPAGRNRQPRREPTRLLRRSLQDSVTAPRATGAAPAREATRRPAAAAPPRR